MKELERELKKLRRANEILKLASAFFAQAEIDRRLKLWLWRAIHADATSVLNATAHWCRRSNAFGKPTCRSTARTKSGASWRGKAPPLLAASSKGSCGARGYEA